MGRSTLRRSMLRLAILSTVLALLGHATLSQVSSATLQNRVEGAWDARTYLLADGHRHPVRGRIFFHGGYWQVLFFVVDESGEPRRGSGEGGTYELDGDRLTFRHELNLSVGEAVAGMSAAPLRMTARRSQESVPEAARVAIDGDALTLLFPSGNRLYFDRVSPPSGRR